MFVSEPLRSLERSNRLWLLVNLEIRQRIFLDGEGLHAIVPQA